MTETWRKLAFAILLFGMAGVTLELYFLDHYEERPQWIPVILLGVGIVAGAWTALRPSRGTVRTLQGLMGLYLVAGVLGVYYHLKSNAEFELELHPDVGGLEMIMETLHGAMPALAPGTMVQLGLLGLLACFRHPALGVSAGESEPS